MVYSSSKSPTQGAEPAQDSVTGYRLVAPRWASTALSGEGARKFGGRWNSPGLPVVYLGESRALTALELLVHLTTPSSRRKSYTLIAVSVPQASIERASFSDPDWNISPATRASTDVGDRWLRDQESLALRVPSTLVHEEAVILLNPLHPDFTQVQTLSQRPFHYDPRFAD